MSANGSVPWAISGDQCAQPTSAFSQHQCAWRVYVSSTLSTGFNQNPSTAGIDRPYRSDHDDKHPDGVQHVGRRRTPARAILDGSLLLRRWMYAESTAPWVAQYAAMVRDDERQRHQLSLRQSVVFASPGQSMRRQSLLEQTPWRRQLSIRGRHGSIPGLWHQYVHSGRPGDKGRRRSGSWGFLMSIHRVDFKTC